MKHNNIEMNIGHVYDWYHSPGPWADHRLAGDQVFLASPSGVASELIS